MHALLEWEASEAAAVVKGWGLDWEGLGFWLYALGGWDHLNGRYDVDVRLDRIVVVLLSGCHG
jgi:hypothetical protein